MTEAAPIRHALIAHLRAAPLACSACGGPQDREGQRLCLACHRIYQRAWRQQRTSDYRKLVRRQSYIDKLMGKIEIGPCVVCGSPDVEMHHPDHETPNLTIWLCRRCHVLWHHFWKDTVVNNFAEWVFIARDCATVRDTPEKPKRKSVRTAA